MPAADSEGEHMSSASWASRTYTRVRVTAQHRLGLDIDSKPTKLALLALFALLLLVIAAAAGLGSEQVRARALHGARHSRVPRTAVRRRGRLGGPGVEADVFRRL
jgi:hypothetical protein